MQTGSKAIEVQDFVISSASHSSTPSPDPAPWSAYPWLINPSQSAGLGLPRFYSIYLRQVSTFDSPRCLYCRSTLISCCFGLLVTGNHVAGQPLGRELGTGVWIWQGRCLIWLAAHRRDQVQVLHPTRLRISSFSKYGQHFSALLLRVVQTEYFVHWTTTRNNAV